MLVMVFYPLVKHVSNGILFVSKLIFNDSSKIKI